MKKTVITLEIEWDPEFEEHPTQWNYDILFDLYGDSVKIISHEDLT